MAATAVAFGTTIILVWRNRKTMIKTCLCSSLDRYKNLLKIMKIVIYWFRIIMF